MPYQPSDAQPSRVLRVPCVQQARSVLSSSTSAAGHATPLHTRSSLFVRLDGLASLWAAGHHYGAPLNPLLPIGRRGER